MRSMVTRPIAFVIAFTIMCLGLIACTQSSITTPDKPNGSIDAPIAIINDRDNACGADRFQHLIGQNESVLETLRFEGPSRIIQPGMPITKDLRRDRINFTIDGLGKIIRIACF